MPFRGLAMLKSTKLITKGGLCYGFAMVITRHPQRVPAQVLRAYQAAAVELSQRTNCVVAWLEDAEAEAARLEAVAADQRGPLHGVPVSVKECYDVAGTASTAGMAAFAR